MGIPEDVLPNPCKNMMDAFARVDMDGRILTCDDLFCDMVGYSRKELLSMTCQDLTPEKWHRFEADILRNHVLSRGYSDIYQKEYRRKNGTVFPVELRVCLHRDPMGVPDFMVVENRIHSGPGQVHWMQFVNRRFFDEGGRLDEIHPLGHDITRHGRNEDERPGMEPGLQHARKMESIGVLVGGIAHDFNNLLSVILGNLELALMGLPPDSPVRDRIAQAGEVGERAAHLIRQMLAYAGKGQLLIETTDLNRIIRENEGRLRVAVAGSAVLALRPAAELPRIQADQEQILQVAVNLISNAAEAMDSGPGIIILRTGAALCDQSILGRSLIDEKPRSGRFVYLEVTDNGCGMDEETRQRLFEPFFTTKFLGRGLGMSAVLGIVRAHHGAILLKSASGKGTTIRVLLPVPSPASVSPEAAPE